MSIAIDIKKVNKIYYLFNKDYKVLLWLFFKKGLSSKKEALKNINLKIQTGEVVGIIGANGAGKSTLMKLVAGITLPTKGEITVNGRIGSLINLSAGFNKNYTGRENIYYKGNLLGMTKKEIDLIIDELEVFADIGEYFDMPLKMYSAGMGARLGFALAIYSNPDILIVDEVFSVGDRNFRNKSKKVMENMFKSGKSILFSSHSDSHIKEFCDRVIYIKDGAIVFDGEVKEGLEIYKKDTMDRSDKNESK